MNPNKELPCKRCFTKPQLKVDLAWIRLTCPICKRNSVTHISHGMDTAVKDWNRYHGTETKKWVFTILIFYCKNEHHLKNPFHNRNVRLFWKGVFYEELSKKRKAIRYGLSYCFCYHYCILYFNHSGKHMVFAQGRYYSIIPYLCDILSCIVCNSNSFVFCPLHYYG